jgi:predicted Rossmann fold flavoprotein
LSFEELDARIIRDFDENPNRDFANSLGKLLPNKMITAVIKRTGIEPHKKINVVTKQERQKVCEILKSFSVRVTGNRGFNEAIITRGGVSVRDINPSTMECKKIKGLYFAGEMIDTDALTGGFNLQIAWSTGHLAGSCCKEV